MSTTLPSEAVTGLRLLVADLREARSRVDRARLELAYWKKGYPELEAMESAVREAREEEEACRARLEAVALAAYREHGVKTLTEHVKIRVVQKVRYEFAQALEWVRANMPALLTLDTKGFEKVALNMPVPPPCVDILQEPTVAISSDLGEE